MAASTELMRRPVEALSLAEVQRYLAPTASESEAYLFIKFCAAYNLNPWTKEAYLIKYAPDAPSTVVIGKDAVMKRAQASPDYKGHNAGIIAKAGNQVTEVEGAVLPDGAVLIGGWCRLHARPKDIDPTTHRVSMREYERKNSAGKPVRSWAEMPATMIRKVAVVQAHREAYPDLVGGMYDEAEMPVVLEGAGYQPTPADEMTDTAPADPDDWAKVCPTHGIEWFKSGKMKTWAHKVDGSDKWCNRPTLFQEIAKDALAALGKTAEEEKKWLAAFVTNPTASQVEALKRLQSTVLQTTDAIGEYRVDSDTGEVLSTEEN
jgi:phage recombination protein Bet